MKQIIKKINRKKTKKKKHILKKINRKKQKKKHILQAYM